MIELLLQAERALAVGMLDQAERLYDQAVEADPRNAIAIVGKARIAIERGEEDEALALARRALAIDPENAAARRLADRLVEVRAYRGEPAAEPEPGSAPNGGDAEPEAAPAATARPEVEPARPRRGLLRRLFRR